MLISFSLRFSVVFGLIAAGSAFCQPLHQRVLVVYNAGVPDSLAIANHYIAQRSIPAAQRCAIHSKSQTFLNLAEYKAVVQGPVRACLTAAGSEKILYIVMTYGVPYGIQDARKYAVDSFVADIWDKYTTTLFTGMPPATHGYYSDAQAEGGYFSPFQTLAAYRNEPNTTLVYSVWRLDGPTPQIAKGLIDKAKAAESAGGPKGDGCFDWRVPLANYPDITYGNGEWDIFRSSQFIRQAGYKVIEDENAAEMPVCSNAAFYAGWYSLQYRDVFTWNTGAIGWHLDSASASQPRNPTFWAPGALSKGITITTGALDEPFLSGLTRPSGTFRNLLEGANVGDAFLRNTRWLKWHILYFGDPLYTPFPGGKTPFKGGTAAESLTIANPRSVVGGVEHATGLITISTPAPPQGRTFTLSNQYVKTATSVPATVTIPAGKTSVSFPITTYPRNYVLNDIIRATSGPLQLRNSLSVTPLLSAVKLQLGSVRGGMALQGVVGMGAKTNAEVVVTLKSDNPLVTLPASIAIPAGRTGAVFSVRTSPVTVITNVTVSAAHGGATVKTALRLTP